MLNSYNYKLCSTRRKWVLQQYKYYTVFLGHGMANAVVISYWIVESTIWIGCGNKCEKSSGIEIPLIHQAQKHCCGLVEIVMFVLLQSKNLHAQRTSTCQYNNDESIVRGVSLRFIHVLV
jgi:hypothetical protein